MRTGEGGAWHECSRGSGDRERRARARTGAAGRPARHARRGLGGAGRRRPDRAVEPAGGGAVRLHRAGGPRPVRRPADGGRTALATGRPALRRCDDHRAELGRRLPDPAQGRQHPAGRVPQHAAARRPRGGVRPRARRRPLDRAAARTGRGALRADGEAVPDGTRGARHGAAVRLREPGPGADQRAAGRRAHGPRAPRRPARAGHRPGGGRRPPGAGDGYPADRPRGGGPHARRPGGESHLGGVAVPAGRRHGACARRGLLDGGHHRAAPRLRDGGGGTAPAHADRGRLGADRYDTRTGAHRPGVGRRRGTGAGRCGGGRPAGRRGGGPAQHPRPRGSRSDPGPRAAPGGRLGRRTGRRPAGRDREIRPRPAGHRVRAYRRAGAGAPGEGRGPAAHRALTAGGGAAGAGGPALVSGGAADRARRGAGGARSQTHPQPAAVRSGRRAARAGAGVPGRGADRQRPLVPERPQRRAHPPAQPAAERSAGDDRS
ncbi:putative Phenylalanyl-tRNA synthetase beta chain [Streptomyces misionensis JCM 4497]